MTGRLIDVGELKKSIIKKLGIANEDFLLESEKAVFEEIDNAPTVDAIPFKWIPFSEQKPSKTDDYLITYPISHEHAYVAIDQWLAEEGKWEAFRTDAVIAWAEIPKPYGSENENKNA